MIEYTIETITPELAEKYIEESTRLFNTLSGNKQRRVRQTTVDCYVKAMKEGRWKMNGETIKFDKEGRLMDGFHRVKAVIKSGMPIDFLVVRGIENEVMDTIDIGLKRSLENALQFQSKCYENGAAAIVKAKMQLDNRNKNMGQSNANAGLEQTEMVEEYIQNETLYNEVAKYSKKIAKDSENTLKTSEVGAIYFHLVYTLGYDKNIVEVFFDNLCSIRRNEKSIYKVTMSKLDELKRQGQNRINEYLMCWNAMVKDVKKRPSLDEYSWFLSPAGMKVN